MNGNNLKDTDSMSEHISKYASNDLNYDDTHHSICCTLGWSKNGEGGCNYFCLKYARAMVWPNFFLLTYIFSVAATDFNI